MKLYFVFLLILLSSTQAHSSTSYIRGDPFQNTEHGIRSVTPLFEIDAISPANISKLDIQGYAQLLDAFISEDIIMDSNDGFLGEYGILVVTNYQQEILIRDTVVSIERISVISANITLNNGENIHINVTSDNDLWQGFYTFEGDYSIEILNDQWTRVGLWLQQHGTSLVTITALVWGFAFSIFYRNRRKIKQIQLIELESSLIELESSEYTEYSGEFTIDSQPKEKNK